MSETRTLPQFYVTSGFLTSLYNQIMKKIITLCAILMAGVTTMNANTLLTDGTMFSTSQKVGLKYVLDYNPDRMLAPAYTALGKTPKA